MNQVYDGKLHRKWRQDRSTYDALEAAAMMCFWANRTVKFKLTRHINEFAAYFNCSQRTIRRALKDGLFYRDEEFGAKVVKIAFFSAERMENKHKEARKNLGRPDAVAKMDKRTRGVFGAMVNLLMAKPLRPGEFRASPYAARIIAMRNSGFDVKLPCEKTIRNYAHSGKHGLTEKALRRKGRKPKPRIRKKGECSSKIGHTFDDRPAEVKNPKTLGHLEGDTVCGPVGKKGVYYSFIDRISSNQYLIYRDNRKICSTIDALKILVSEYRGKILSVTFDRGKEFDDWMALEKVIGAKVYYADPYRACQRAKNENNHLLVRRTSPKGQRLVHRSVRASMAAAEYINNYPRRKFGGKSSNEVHAELLAG